MTLKHTIAGHKTWDNAGHHNFSLSEILNKFMKAIKLGVPVGYQDESGFHYGTKPASDRKNWPMVW
jgi:hypothetical protein